ncbi:HD-domain PDEase-like protein [Trametopsis cervina]|nr:HD-domain PDEase-like protein [Trametopsis cervina]
MDSPLVAAVDLGAGFGPDGFEDDDITFQLEVDAPEPSRGTIPSERTFKDNVHDYITLDHRICQIIDTPHFQRLRHVQQLGTSSYVWPAASHNRFAHCLGVAHLAQKLIKTLQKKQPELRITDEDVFCVTAAGLCHDLGHGPWSHVWDSMFIPKALPDKKWKHEDASEMMFDALIKLDHVQVSAREATIVKALIAGESSRCRSLSPPVKLFLFEIVANKRNGLDVDKFDYIARDNHAIGQGENISLNKLLFSARVIDNEICYDIKDANSVFELCWARFSLHKRIYNHKTAKAIEHMLIDALLAAEPYMKIANQIDDPQRFLYLTDDIKARVQMSTEPELAEARDILDRIDRRKLYKCVDYRVWPWQLREFFRERVTAASIVQAARRYAAEQGRSDHIDPSILLGLRVDHVIVDVAVMHYGMREKNPLRYVKFYSKRHPDRATHAEAGDISHIMPGIFAEFLIRIYTRENKYHGLIQAGYRYLLKDLHEEESLQLDSPELLPTTLAEPGPRQPSRALSRVTSLRLAPEGDDTAVDGFGQNVFTTVPPSYNGE